MEVITSHTNADFDTLASMVGAGKLYPEARLVFSGSLEKGLKDAIDKKKIELPRGFEKARDIDLDKVTRIILVDVRQAGRLGVFNGLVAKAGVDVHVYDHHPSTAGDVRASFEAIELCGSTSTVISLILRDRKIALTRDEATILMAGIYEDTGFLSYPSTTVRDYEAASFLLSTGADLSKVSDLLRKELTPEDVSLLNEFLHSEARYTIGGVEVVIVEGYLERYAADISSLAHRIRDIEGMDCLFMLVDSEDRVHMIARSRTAHVDVGKVARAVGGGGHAHAASATLKGVTLIEARERLLEAIRESVVPRKTAAEIMSFPPIVFPSALTLSAAMEQMRRYNINAAPVVDNGAGVIGVITRQVVDKAVYHGLGNSTVSDYMTTEYETVSHGSSIDEIRAKVMGRGVRLLPVLKDRSLVGVITRTDLIKILQEGLREAEGIGAGKPRSLSRLIRERLPAWAAGLLKEAGEAAEGLGVNAYAVGGFVRDLLLRRENLDIDIVIEGGDGIAFANELAARLGARVRAHRRFRTAVVVLPDGYKLDVATARLEYYEKPGALPTVEVSSLKLDLYRRDFVINTLAVALNPRRFGELIDFFGAQRDIKEKAVRVLHNLSFVEDPTRMLRAVRFSEKFGFRISKHTLHLIRNYVKLDVFKDLSGPRLFDELRNMLGEDVSVKCVGRLHELGLLRLIHGGITYDVEREAFIERAREAAVWHRLLYAKDGAEGWVVIFLALTDTLNDEELDGLLKRLCVEGKKPAEIFASRADGLDALRRISSGAVTKNSEVYGLLKDLPMEVVLYLLAKARDDGAKKALASYVTKLRYVETALHGDDLKSMGIEEGPAIGEALRLLLDKRLDGGITTREEEEGFVRDYVKAGGGAGQA